MSESEIDIVIEGRRRSLAGFPVRRVLPFTRRRMVGPFVFLDEMGPHVLAPGQGLDVAPHPHIGLSTLTYLFSGELLHRDSLGTVQSIRPGEVNWMTAGSGIVHSERTPPALRAQGHELFGVQAWVALPREEETRAPSFQHFGEGAIPHIRQDGVEIRLLLGEIEAACSPVPSYSPAVYADVTLARLRGMALPERYEEIAVYVVGGELLDENGTTYGQGNLVVFGSPGQTIRAGMSGPLRALILGGDRLEGKRYIDWNFVNSSKERIARARADWASQRFPPVPGETEFIPLPKGLSPVVDYP